jgi:hypothetical protein
MMTSPAISHPTYVDILTHTSKSFKLPSMPSNIRPPTLDPIFSTLALSNRPGSLKVSGGDDISPPIRIFKTFSTNALVADFTGLNASRSDVIELISTNFENVEVVNFLKQGKVAEVTFTTSDAAFQAVEKGLYYMNCTIPLTRSFSTSQDIVGITVKNLPGRPKEETYDEILSVFGKYGTVTEIKLHYYGTSQIRMPSCAVILDITNKEEGIKALPRQVFCFGKKVDLFWKHAPPFCSYCKCEDHYIKTCPTLATKNANKNEADVTESKNEDVESSQIEMIASKTATKEVSRKEKQPLFNISIPPINKPKLKLANKRLAKSILTNEKKQILKQDHSSTNSSISIFQSIDIENNSDIDIDNNSHTKGKKTYNYTKTTKPFDLSYSLDNEPPLNDYMYEDLDEAPSAF